MNGAQIFGGLDKIIDVTFVNVLKRFDRISSSGQGLENYSFKSLSLKVPANGSENDISKNLIYDISYLVTAVKALENPVKYDEGAKHMSVKSDLSIIFDELVNPVQSRPKSLDATTFGTKSTYVKYDDAILPGINALLSKSIYANVKDTKISAFEELLVCMLHNIALHKNDITGPQIIDNLKRNDRVVFSAAIRQLMTSMRNTASNGNLNVKDILSNDQMCLKMIYASLKRIAETMRNDIQSNSGIPDINVATDTMIDAAVDKFYDDTGVFVDDGKACNPAFVALGVDTSKAVLNTTFGADKLHYPTGRGFTGMTLPAKIKLLTGNKLSMAANYTTPVQAQDLLKNVLSNYSILLNNTLTAYNTNIAVSFAKNLFGDYRDGLINSSPVASTAAPISGSLSMISSPASPASLVVTLDFYKEIGNDCKIFYDIESDVSGIKFLLPADFMPEFKEILTGFTGGGLLTGGLLTGEISFDRTDTLKKSQRYYDYLFALAIIKLSFDNPNLANLTQVTKSDLTVALKYVFNNFKKLSSKLNSVEQKINNISQYAKDFKNDFVETATAYVTFGESRRALVQPTKNNLSAMKSSYDTIVLDTINYGIFSKYFNLIKIDTKKTVPLEDARSMTETEMSNYRLNAKKPDHNTIASFLGGGLNDIVLIQTIPLILSIDRALKIFYSDRDFITLDEIMRGSTDTQEFFRNFGKKIYYLPTGTSLVPLIAGKNIDVNAIAYLVTKNPGPEINWTSFFNSLLKRKTYTPDQRKWWESFEYDAREAEFNEANRWTADGPIFVKMSNDGKTVLETQAAESCNLMSVNMTDTECIQFLTDCVFADGNWNSKCATLYNDDRHLINIPATGIAEKIREINPLYADALLKKFNVGTVRTKKNGEGLILDEYEKIGDWMKKLFNSQLDEHFGADVVPLKKFLEVNGARQNNFVKYLQLLVDWVNVNQQVLNPELVGKDKRVATSNQPPPDSSFVSYNNFPSKCDIRLKRMNILRNDLDRLKAKLVNETIGSRTAISNIINMANVATPYNTKRYVYSNPVMNYQYVSGMYGGIDFGDYETESMKANNTTILSQIYRSLMNDMKNSSVKLSDKSYTEMERKLATLEKLEKDIREEFRLLYNRLRLQTASKGWINTSEMKAPEINELLNKHSGLFSLVENYKTRSVEIADALRAITTAILEKKSA